MTTIFQTNKGLRLLSFFVFTCVLAMQFVFSLPAHAAVSNWMRGATLVPTYPEDFSSASFQQSLQNLKATGANSVAFVIPYYQSNTGSTDIGPGWNTPTDATLGSAIDYAHSLGLSVTLNVHDDPYDGSWRAYISPGDRDTWYQNYGNILAHVASIAQSHHAEMIVLGTEMVGMASDINPDNTQRWVGMINRVRSIYNGNLTYSANSNNNNWDNYQDEKEHIGFWSSLDYAGLSAYYGLGWGGDDVNTLKGAWDYWNTNDLKGFQSKVGKPLLMVEVGYRSLDNSYQDPWNWGRGGSPNLQTQANDYEATIGYWNDYSYMQGVYFWNWQTDPNAGGNGSNDFTPQHKPAQDVMTRWFTTPAAPNPGATNQPTFTSNVSANPGGPNLGSSVTITANVQSTGPVMSNGIIDLEVYDSSDHQVYQQYTSVSSFAAGDSRSFNFNWTAGAAGTYSIRIGVFNGDWSKNYHWNQNAGSITVSGSTTNPPSNPPPSGGSKTTNIWWPTDGTHMTGVQPLKAMIEGMDVSQYEMYWQVDGDQLNQMSNSTTDYPHKESLVDFTSWTWKGGGPYTLTFVSKDNSGAVISQKSVNIFTQ